MILSITTSETKPLKRIRTSFAKESFQLSQMLSIFFFKCSTPDSDFESTDRHWYTFRHLSGCLGLKGIHFSPQMKQCSLNLKPVLPDLQDLLVGVISSVLLLLFFRFDRKRLI